MVSKYFELKTSTDNFKQETNELIEKLKDKKVILYGAGQGYEVLEKEYNFKNKLGIIAIADKKFEKKINKNADLREIQPNQIKNENFDAILVTNEQPNGVMRYLLNTLEISPDKIYCIFKEEIKEEALNVLYLYRHKFDKTLPKLVKKLKNKKVVLYGAGLYLKTILKYFDLSKLDIIGVSDKKFEKHEEGETFCGYKVLAPDEIKALRPDYILVSTKFYISIIEEMYTNFLIGTKIKVKPLVMKSFLTLLKEIWT